MSTVSALEFQRKFGRIQHEARREPVEITRHGRREFVLMSAEQYDWIWRWRSVLDSLHHFNLQ